MLDQLGITVTCGVCGKAFYCDDGDFICSTACDRIAEEQEEEEWRSV